MVLTGLCHSQHSVSFGMPRVTIRRSPNVFSNVIRPSIGKFFFPERIRYRRLLFRPEAVATFATPPCAIITSFSACWNKAISPVCSAVVKYAAASSGLDKGSFSMFVSSLLFIH